MDVDAEDATWKDEATVYTNIDKATEGKWKLTGGRRRCKCRARYHSNGVRG